MHTTPSTPGRPEPAPTTLERSSRRAPIRRAPTLVAVLLSATAFPLTITGASVALPGIAADLHADLTSTQWVVNGYNTCFAAFLVVAGSLSDLFGRRRVFASGVALFCLGSLLSAFADDITMLNALRALAGAGAAAATTAGSATLAATFDAAARRRAFGLLGTVLGAGLAFGPTIGGLLVDTLGWRAVFAVPAALAMTVLLMVPALPPGRERTGPGDTTECVPGRGRTRRSIDRAGAALFTSTLMLAIFAVVQAPERGLNDPLVLGAALGAGGCGVGFTIVERRVAAPMFDLGLLANHRFLSSAVAAGAQMAVLVPLLVYLPSYLIAVVGLDAGPAGTWLLMLTVPVVVLPAVGSAIARRSPTVLVVGSVAVSGIGVLLLATLGPDSTWLTLLGPLLLIGTGVGLSTGVVDGLALSSVRPEQIGMATGVFNTTRLTSETVVLAAVGALLATLTGGELTGNGFAEALRLVCLALAGLAATATVCVAVLAWRSDHSPRT